MIARARLFIVAIAVTSAICVSILHPAQAQGVNLAQLAAEVQSLQSQVTSLQSTVNSQASTIQTLQGTVSGLQTTVANQAKIINLFSLQNGVGANTELYLTGVNLHIVNGEGETRTADGLGNLIVGYNETRASLGAGTDVRTGSHNIITGLYNNYSYDGGIIGGYENSLTGVEEFCVGEGNTVSLDQSCISGGRTNTVNAIYGSISGGVENTVNAIDGSVSGGYLNTASGHESSVSGGQQNTASGVVSSVSGGGANTASGVFASLSGGLYGTASGEAASVSGGFDLSANGSYTLSGTTWSWDGVGPTWAATTYNGH